MNKRHVIALIVGIVLLAVPILSCVPKQTAAPVATDSFAKLSDLTTLETALSKEIDKKADKGDIPEDAGLSKSEVQKVVDDSLGGYIQKSELEQWLVDNGYKKSSTSTTPAGTTAGEYGQLVDADGDLELWLDKVGGATDDEVFTTSGGGTQDRGNFTFVVLNKDTSSRHDFKITLTFSPDEDSMVGSSVALTKAMASADNSMYFCYCIGADHPCTSTTCAFSSLAFTKNDDLSFKSDERSVAKDYIETYKVYVYVTQTENDIVDWLVEYSIKDNG